MAMRVMTWRLVGGPLAVVAIIASVLAGTVAAGSAADSVTITSGPPSETTSTSATFGFTGAGAVTAFRCLLDTQRTATPCTSPTTVSGLTVGEHTLTVLGYRGDVPVGVSDRWHWKIIPPPPPPAEEPPPSADPEFVPAVPDFMLSYDPVTKKLPLAAVPGGTSPELGVVVSRLYGSSGPLTVGWSQLPTGVTLSVTPDAQTSPTAFRLRLSATGPAVKPGLGLIKLTVTPVTAASGTTPRSLLIPYAIVEQYDLAVTGLEITHGIQRVWSEQSALPARDPANPAKPIAYPDGITLGPCAGSSNGSCLTPAGGAATIVRGKRTFVRAFAILASPNLDAIASGKAKMLLRGRAVGGNELLGSPLLAANLTPIVGGDPMAVPLSTLLSSTGVFQFTLPPWWTDVKSLQLEAELVPPVLYGSAECTSAACAANNHLTLTSIKPRSTGFVNVWNIGFIDKSGPPLQQPSTVYAPLAEVLPLADGQLRTGPYRAYLDATKLFSATTVGQLIENCNTSIYAFVGLCDVKDVDYLTRLRDKLLLERVDDFAHPGGCVLVGATDDFKNCPDFVAGVAPANSYGLSRGKISYRIPISVANQQRPLTSVGHELVHGLGAEHADSACNGGGDGQKNEGWWPDVRGRIQGIGLRKTKAVQSPTGGLFSILYPGPPPKQTGGPDLGVYDLMSYCATDGGSAVAWISTINWERSADWITSLHGPSTKAQIGAGRALGEEPVLLVRGFVLDGRVVVTTARPALGTSFLGPPDSLYRVVLRGRQGNAILEAPLLVGVGDAHGGSSDIQMEARIPLGVVDASRLPAGLDRLDVFRDGSIVGGIVRGRSRPVVTVVSPSRGARVGGAGKSVRISWTAADADLPALRGRVEYSADGGASWRQVWAGPGDGSATLPAFALSASNNALLRVAISDGLDETIAVSEPFVSLGSPPTVEILAPLARETVTTGGPVALQAQAWTDEGTLVPPSSISWWEGRRKLAVGDAAHVSLPTGTHVLRAVARDPRAREASATVRVRVVAAEPLVLVRRAPGRISKGARSVVLQLAATAQAADRLAAEMSSVYRGSHSHPGRESCGYRSGRARTG